MKEKKEKKGYKNSAIGKLQIIAEIWAPGETKKVSEAMKSEAKFKRALELGMLVKV